MVICLSFATGFDVIQLTAAAQFAVVSSELVQGNPSQRGRAALLKDNL